VDNLRDDQAVGDSSIRTGTLVRVELDPATDRDLSGVFRAYSDDDHEFVRSRTVVRLFEYGVRFVSRSEAKRLMRGLDKFREVELDFAGVHEVGQGFVDEVVRVWPSQHPGTVVSPVNANPAVLFMIERGLRRDR
jgi:hypothetical protein